MRRGAAALCVLTALLLTAAAGRAWPGAERELQHLRELGGGSLAGVTCLERIDRTELALSSGGLTLRADLYEPDSAAKGGIVLLHGSSVDGRRLPLYPALAHELVRAGYAVIAPDLRGFGESDDPRRPEEPASWDFAADAVAALDSLLGRVPLDPEQVYVVGHSFGAGPGLAAAQRNGRFAKAVLIGPTRRIGERFLAPGAPDSAYYVERWQRDMRLARPVPFETMAAALHPVNIENFANGTFTARVPVLLTDAERESQADRDSLRAVAGRMGPAATYWTTPGTDHYLHTARMLRERHRWAPERFGSTPCYNTAVLRDFVAALDRWLMRGIPPASAGGSAGR